MKKIISLILCLAVMLTAVSVFAASDITAGLSVKGLGENIVKGEEFTAIFHVNDKDYPIYSYQFGLDYDKDYFEVVKIKSDIKDGYDGINVIDNTNGKADFAYYTGGVKPSENNNDNLYVLATVTFKTLKTIDEDISIKLNTDRTKFLNENGEVISADLNDLDIVIPSKPTKSSPSSNTFTSGEYLKLTTKTKNADIYYTTNADDTPSTKMNGSIKLPNKNVTYYAVAKLYGISSQKSSFAMSFRGGNSSSGGSGGSGSSSGGRYTPNTGTNTNTNTNNNNNNTSNEKYSDISGHWAKDYIKTLSDKSIVNGYEDGTFKPGNTVTRAEIAKMIVCALGQKAATDVNLTFTDKADIADWAAGYIQTAVNLGILNGYEDGTFKPSQPVSRKEMAKIAMAAFKYGEDKTSKLEFSDTASIPTWAYGYVAAAVKNRIITGYEDNTFKPDGNVTRAEACTILAKCIK